MRFEFMTAEIRLHIMGTEHALKQPFDRRYALIVAKIEVMGNLFARLQRLAGG